MNRLMPFVVRGLTNVQSQRLKVSIWTNMFQLDIHMMPGWQVFNITPNHDYRHRLFLKRPTSCIKFLKCPIKKKSVRECQRYENGGNAKWSFSQNQIQQSSQTNLFENPFSILWRILLQESQKPLCLDEIRLWTLGASETPL